MARLGKRDRLHQACRYLQHRWGVPVRLRVERKLPAAYRGCVGACEATQGGPPPLIRILGTVSLGAAMPTVLHEYAHAMAFARDPRAFERRSGTGGHDALFYRCLRQIENDWDYEGGASESVDF